VLVCEEIEFKAFKKAIDKIVKPIFEQFVIEYRQKKNKLLLDFL